MPGRWQVEHGRLGLTFSRAVGDLRAGAEILLEIVHSTDRVVVALDNAGRLWKLVTVDDSFVVLSCDADRTTALSIVNALKNTGGSALLPEHVIHDHVDGLYRTIRESRRVVALWSHKGAQSAELARYVAMVDRPGVLLPVRLDDVDVPPGCGCVGPASLASWNGDITDPVFTQLISALRASAVSLPRDRAFWEQMASEMV